MGMVYARPRDLRHYAWLASLCASSTQQYHRLQVAYLAVPFQVLIASPSFCVVVSLLLAGGGSM